jgi:hypothetical protein
VVAVAAATGVASAADEASPGIAVVSRAVAVKNVCAWPNLTPLPDGAVIATIFNQPCHGTWEGDVESHATTDGGATWTRGDGLELPSQSRLAKDQGLSLADGRLLTAYYARKTPRHDGYQMATVTWRLPPP